MENKKQKKKSKNSPKEVLENKLPRYIIGAFSIVTAMAWNEYVKEQMEEKVKNKSRARFLYAITATIILIIAVFVIHKIIDVYMDLKEKTDNVVKEITCHKKAIVRIYGMGTILIQRSGCKRLIWSFNMSNLLSNARYDVLVNSPEPVRLKMKTDAMGKLHNVITHDWEINNLLGYHLDFKDYVQGPIYSGIISVSK
jgi:hypothetical protein